MLLHLSAKHGDDVVMKEKVEEITRIHVTIAKKKIEINL